MEFHQKIIATPCHICYDAQQCCKSNSTILRLLDYSKAKKKREKSMMTCERCGKEMPDNIAICPSCGTITSAVQGRPQPPTNHGPYPPDGPPMGGYGQGYSPQPGYMQPPQPGYMQQPQPGYMQPPQQGYMQPPQSN